MYKNLFNLLTTVHGTHFFMDTVFKVPNYDDTAVLMRAYLQCFHTNTFVYKECEDVLLVRLVQRRYFNKR